MERTQGDRNERRTPTTGTAEEQNLFAQGNLFSVRAEVSKHDAPEQREPFPEGESRPERPRYILTFFILFLIWVIFSGRFDAFHLTLGVISCAMVSYFSADLLFTSPRKENLFLVSFRFAFSYLPWLFRQIVLANIHVTWLVFHPRMMDLIEPHIFKFRSDLTKEMSLVTLANSITLTPGTITIAATMDGDFRVHAIDRKSAEGLPGDMQRRIGRVFEDENA